MLGGLKAAAPPNKSVRIRSFCYRRHSLRIPLLRSWLAVVVVAIAIHLGGHPLFDADEGRNAEVGREMAATNDYVMPRLNTLPYLDKPIVYFAAEAAVMEVLGPTEVAARLPAYLFTLATAAVLFFFARRVWGGDAPDAPYIAAIVFLAMPLVIAFARTVIFDSALMFFTTVALAAFYFAIVPNASSSGASGFQPGGETGLKARSSRGRASRWSIVAWIAMGFAMITKGPVTFILVLAVAVPFAWRRKALRAVFSLLGIVLFVAVCVPWVWGVSQVVPEFLRYVLVTETAARMATDELQRTGPPWYFIPYLVGGALPWSIVALASWKKLRKPDPATLYCILAIVIPFVFFSISQSKRPQYILPLMPALALLIARVWSEARTRGAAIVLASLGVLLVTASFFAHRTKMRPELAAVADETALAFGAAFALGGLVALFAKRRELVLVALTLPTIALPLLADPLLDAIGQRRSAKQFVSELAPHVKPTTQVIGVEAFSGSLAFYLQRPLIVITRDASELTSNYLMRRHENYTSDPRSVLKPLPWFERSLAATNERVYVVREQDAVWRRMLEARGWKLIAAGGRHVAYGR
jgi:4-amino-4-deoxy-L-arabinose transferase-like glycosyltransferase